MKLTYSCSSITCQSKVLFTFRSRLSRNRNSPPNSACMSLCGQGRSPVQSLSPSPVAQRLAQAITMMNSERMSRKSKTFRGHVLWKQPGYQKRRRYIKAHDERYSLPTETYHFRTQLAFSSPPHQLSISNHHFLGRTIRISDYDSSQHVRVKHILTEPSKSCSWYLCGWPPRWS